MNPNTPAAPDIEMGINQDIATLQPKKTTWLGRAVRPFHWSHVPIVSCCSLSILGALGAGVFAVVEGYVFQRYVETGIGAVICVCLCGNSVTHIISGIGIAYYKPFKSFEQQLKEYKRLNQKLIIERLAFQNNVNQLQKTKNDLQAANKEAKGSVAALEMLLSDKNAELATVVNQLQNTKESFTHLKELFEKFKEENKQIFEKLEEFKALNNQFQQSTNDLNENRKKIDGEVSEFDQENAELQGHLRTLLPMMAQFATDVESMDSQFKVLDGELGEVHDAIKELDIHGQRFQDGTEQLTGSVIPAIKDLNTNLDSQLARAERLAKKLHDDIGESEKSSQTHTSVMVHASDSNE